MAVSQLTKKIKEQRKNNTLENRMKLEYYLSMGYLEKAKKSIYSGVQVHDTMLISPIYWGHVNIVKFLIEKCNVNINRRALFVAVENNKLEIVKYLIKKGANVHTNDNDALLCAIFYGHLDIVKHLIEKGADYRHPRAYIIAMNRGHEEILEYLNKTIQSKNKN